MSGFYWWFLQASAAVPVVACYEGPGSGAAGPGRGAPPEPQAPPGTPAPRPGGGS
ncbi:hypothetical protein GCM10023329_41310 [Streptomyces sanyensis]|uniref:Uncharacterized protein n=1 Tax=Streptomyces sanyensis TaxID=568869 RepID=A0ABP9AWC8_9ACTN